MSRTIAPRGIGATEGPALLLALASGLLIVRWGWLGAAALAGLIGLMTAYQCGRDGVWGRCLLAALLIATPDFSLHRTLGFRLLWSSGLTFSNFLLPVISLPVLAGAWRTHQKLVPAEAYKVWRRWRGFMLFAPLTLVPAYWLGQMAPGESVLLLAHWLKLLGVCFLMGFILAGLEDPRLRRNLIWILAAGMGVNLLLAAAQTGGWLTGFSPLSLWSPGRYRASGTFYDANMFGCLAGFSLILLLPLTACRLAANRPRSGGGWMGLGLVVMAGAVAVSASRAAWLVVLAGCAGLIWRRRWLALGLALGLGLAWGWLFFHRADRRIASAWHALATHAVWSGVDAGVMRRERSMRQAWEQWQFHPWLGLGWGRALDLGVAARGPGGWAGQRFTGAQNQYLTVLAETGILGLMIYGFMLAGLPDAWRMQPSVPATSAANSIEDAWNDGLFAGWLGLLTAACTLELFYNARLWALLLLVLYWRPFKAIAEAPAS